MLAGMRKLRGFMGMQCKRALTKDDLITLLSSFDPTDLDDLVFISIVLSSFHALLHLSEITQPDSHLKHSFRKTTLHHSVKLTPNTFSFTLPTHQANCYFESSMILIESHVGHLCPRQPFLQYLTARDIRFPLHPQLWLRSMGKVLTYSWVMNKLKSTLGSDVVGHSLCSGGATSLAIAGTPDDHIQA